MTGPKTDLLRLLTIAALLGWWAAAADAQPPDALSQSPKWQPPEASRVKAQALQWLAEKQADQPTLAKAEALWSALPQPPDQEQLLGCLAETFALAEPAVAELVETCSQPKRELSPPTPPWLTAPGTPPLLAHNMRLLYGRWLVQQQMYDEAKQRLAGLAPRDVVAPALLLFYQSVAHHMLLDKQAGLKTIEQLLAGSQQSPRRYVAVARLMQQDLEILDEKSLDHIARRMGDIRRRLDLGRGGKNVIDREQRVIDSLDELIKKLEEQQKNSSGGGGGDIRSNRPAPDSMPMGGKGRGNVTKRSIGGQSGWGDLPPKQREEALQQIGRDFPSHYRDVIEQYFRRLAGDEEN